MEIIECVPVIIVRIAFDQMSIRARFLMAEHSNSSRLVSEPLPSAQIVIFAFHQKSNEWCSIALAMDGW